MGSTFQTKLKHTNARAVHQGLPKPTQHGSNDEALAELIQTYDRQGKAVEVNFRELSPLKPGEDRLTHLMHSYPAKLLPNIPSFFINCASLVTKDQLVYDPFCGTGTVMVEGIASGKRAAGSDSNPLARLIACAKTTWINNAQLIAQLERIEQIAPSEETTAFSPVVSVEKWFVESTAHRLGQIRSAIESVATDQAQAFFLVCLSQIVKRCSLADPRLSVPVRLRTPDTAIPQPLELFSKVARQNIQRMASMPNGCAPVYVGSDARIPLSSVKELSTLADLIVTSPPYAGAQKYIRASSLSIGWLSLAPESKLRNLEKLNIGREHLCASEIPEKYTELSRDVQNEVAGIAEKNMQRADIFGIYMIEMQSAAASIRESLKIGGHLVLIMGDNQICGQPVRTSQYVRDLFVSIGFSVTVELIDHIQSRGLMTKRNKTAGLISQEHVFLLRRDR